MKWAGRILSVGFLSATVFIPAGQAQKSTHSGVTSASGYKLLGLKVSGTTRYTDKEILSASGLRIGQEAADGDFKEAVRQLGNSGMFSDASYSYTASGSGVRLDLQLTDIDQSKLFPAHFENFVWFTDDELQTALQSRVPLFKQLLPESGSLPDWVSEALQAMLTEKQAPGRVDFLHSVDQATGKAIGYDYSVEEVTILIRKVEFPGASPELAELLTTAAHRAIGTEYLRSALAAVTRLDLLPVYLQRGYLKASFGPSEAHVASKPTGSSDSTENAEVEVDVLIPVNPGKVYSVSGLDWKGNTVWKASELTALVRLTTGQPADAVQLGRDLEEVARRYGTRGYITAKVAPNAEIDEEKGTVHYELNVTEGDQYKMGELEITGLDTQARARMTDAWTLRTGEVYNADYPRKFIADTRGFLPEGASWATTVHESPDARDKTVDVEIHFKQE